MSSSLSPQTKLLCFAVGCVLLAISLVVDWIRKKRNRKTSDETLETLKPLIKQMSREAGTSIVKEMLTEDLKKNPKLLEIKSLEKIYPYVVPSSYFQDFDPLPKGYTKLIGHDIYSVFVYDLDGMVRILNAKDIEKLGQNSEKLSELAIHNLERLAKERKIDMKGIPKGPQGKTFMIVADHWAAATCILLPALWHMARTTLGVDQICASIPDRRIMILFPKADRQYRDEMRAMIRKNEEHDLEKPLTWDLFEIRDGEIVPLVEI